MLGQLCVGQRPWEGRLRWAAAPGTGTPAAARRLAQAAEAARGAPGHSGARPQRWAVPSRQVLGATQDRGVRVQPGCAGARRQAMMLRTTARLQAKRSEAVLMSVCSSSSGGRMRQHECRPERCQLATKQVHSPKLH